MPSDVFEAFTDNTGCDTRCVSQFKTELTTIKNNKQSKDATLGGAEITEKINSLNTDFSTVGKGPTDPGYSTAVTNLNDNLNQIQSGINDYNENVVKKSSDLLKRITTSLNVNNQVSILGEALSESASAKNDMLEAQESLSTAYTREALIDTKDDAISYQQTWGYIARPLKRNSIPILIIFTLLFFGTGIVGLWFVSPYASAAQSISAGETGFFQHPAVWMTMVIVVVIGLILGALKLGKQI